MFNTEHSAGIADALRRLAHDIECGNVPAPYSIPLHVYGAYDSDAGQYVDVTAGHARQAMRLAPGNWSKRWTDFSLMYSKSYGTAVTLTVDIQREQVCRRVQIGTRIEPAQEATPEREVPVYTWDCTDETPEP